MNCLRRIWAVMQKEMLHLFRDNVCILIAFAAPIVLMMLMGYIYYYQKVTQVPIVFYDQDQTEISRTIISCFADSERFKILPPAQSTAEVERDMDSEKAFMGVVIPPHLKQDLQEGRSSEVAVITNGTNVLVMNTVATAANVVIQTISAKVAMQVMEGAGMAEQKAYKTLTSLNFRNRVWYNPTLSYLIFMVVGLMGVIMQQITFLGVALSFVKEREQGSWLSLRMAGMKWGELLLGKSAVYFLVYFLDAIIIYLLGFVWFGIPMRGSVMLLLGLTVLFLLVLLVVGMAISALTFSMAQAIELSMLVAVPSFLISGYTWPYLSMPLAVKFVSQILPLTHFLIAFRSIVVMGNGWPMVQSQFFYLFLFIVVCLPVVVIALKRKLEAVD